MKVFNCRLCKGQLSEPKLNLGKTPLANEFLKEPKQQDLFPLEVCVCEDCGHYQLNEQIDPERVFRDYVYVAGISPVNVEHFRQYAVKMVDQLQLKSGSKVLDIASNDGTLLQHFKNLGMEVLGIDPARNLAEEANKKGIPTIPEFFTETYANEILKKYGQFDLITANNVFAHIPDMIGFTKGVKKLLSPDGIFTFEVSYFMDVCKKSLFDTIYHEHSSYHTINPLISFFRRCGLDILDVESIPNHGGSIRVFVDHSTGYVRSVEYGHKLVEKEHHINKKIARLQKDIKLLGYELREKLQHYKDQNNSIAIYGTPAKCTTLMYTLDIDEKIIDFAVEDNLLKQGTYTPGKHIPVLASSAIYERKPNVLLVLAWNFAESIMKKHSNFEGTWIVPLPELKEYK
jgi:SAM-dependent methyltransferase